MANRRFYERLSKSAIQNKLALRHWTRSTDNRPGQQAVHFQHPMHGTVSVHQAAPNEFHVKHGGKIVGLLGQKGVFNNAKDALGHAARYMAAIPGDKPHTNMYNMDMGVKNTSRQIQWNKDEPSGSPSGTPIDRGPKLDPVKVKQFQEGFNAGGPSLSQMWSNLKDGLGMGTTPQKKSEDYFGQLLSKAKKPAAARTAAHVSSQSQAPAQSPAKLVQQSVQAPSAQQQPYNPKLERPNQRARVKQVLEEVGARPDKAKLSLSSSNSKLAKDGIVSFNLPAVETCPGAGECAKYCYADTGSFLRFWKTTMPPRVANWLGSKQEDFVPRMIDLIDKYKKGRDENGKPVKMNGIRIHDSGDFYSPDYIQKWTEIAKAHPDVKMYAYTKSHHPALRSHIENLHALPNVNIVQSLGSKYDHLVDPSKPHAVVFETPEQMHQAGYADAMSTDLTAADKANTKVGLYIHGSSMGGYKGLEDHLKGNPKLNAAIMGALGRKKP